MYRRLTIRLAAFAVLVASTSLCPRAALAANYYFSGASGTVWDATTADWSSAHNGPYNQTWGAGGVAAAFEGTPTTVTVNGTIPNVAGITFSVSGYTLGGSGTLTMTNDAINANAAGDTINCGISSAGTITETGNLTFGGAAALGSYWNIHTGKLTLTSGASFSNTGAQQGLYVDYGATLATAYTTSGNTYNNTSSFTGTYGATFDFRDGTTNALNFNGTAALTYWTGASSEYFDLGSGTNDSFNLGAAMKSGGTNTVYVNLLAGQHLVNGTYNLLTAASGVNVGQTWTLNTSLISSLGGATLALNSSATAVTLTITGAGSSGTATPAISISTTASRFVLGSSLTGVISGTVSNSGTAAYSYTSITGSGTGTLASISPQSATVAASGGTQAYTATLNGTAATAGTSYTYGTTVTDGTTPASSSTVSLTAVNKRTVTSAAQVNLGDFLKGAVVSVSQDVSPTSSGSNATTANATVAAATGGTENGLTVSGSLQTFDGTASVTRTLSGTLDTTSYGTKTGSWNMAVTGEALPGMTAYSNATAGFTANVGNATAASGSFGTALTALVISGASLNGLASQTGGGTEAALLAGTASSTTNVGMAWETKASALTTPSIQLVSDVVQLSGALSADTELQMSYSGTGNGGPIYLAQLEAGNQWVKVVAGAGHDGSHAWATVGGTGTFAVVPEPATLALLATGLIGLLAYAWRKRK